MQQQLKSTIWKPKAAEELEVDEVRGSIPIRWWHLIWLKPLLFVLYPPSCDKSTAWSLLVIQSDVQVLTRSAPGTGSWVWEPGVQKCHAGPIYIATTVCNRGQSCATPSPFLVSHCPIDNSHSMNGMTERGNSSTGICHQCLEDSCEGKHTMTGFLLMFSTSTNHESIIKKLIVSGKALLSEKYSTISPNIRVILMYFYLLYYYYYPQKCVITFVFFLDRSHEDECRLAAHM